MMAFLFPRNPLCVMNPPFLEVAEQLPDNGKLISCFALLPHAAFALHSKLNP